MIEEVEGNARESTSHTFREGMTRALDERELNGGFDTAFPGGVLHGIDPSLRAFETILPLLGIQPAGRAHRFLRRIEATDGHHRGNTHEGFGLEANARERPFDP